MRMIQIETNMFKGVIVLGVCALWSLVEFLEDDDLDTGEGENRALYPFLNPQLGLLEMQ